jgi:cation:H+ antiporter
MVWLQFLIGALVIIFAGSRLSRYGDIIARRTGLGGAVIGLALLATVTSLPEIAVSATSILLVGSPDLAVGGLLGSNTFNLAIIVLLDIIYRSGPLLSRIHPSHILSAGLGSSFIGIVVALIFFYQQGRVVEILGIGLSSPIFIFMYVLSLGLVSRFEKKLRLEAVRQGTDKKPEEAGERRIYLKTAAVALAIVAAGIWLSLTGEKIAAVTGWGESFVGTLFLAAATSLPELVVSVGALRLGAADMAVSNLLGSNLFNMVMIAVCDILYRRGPLLASVSPASVMAGLTSLVMTGIVITALIYRTRSPSLVRVGGETVALFATYIAGNYLLFLLSSR